MTKEEFDNCVILAKMGQPYYTQYQGRTWRTWFNNGDWFCTNAIHDIPDNDYEHMIDCASWDLIQEYWPDEIIITEEEYHKVMNDNIRSRNRPTNT